jgi:hypothetical protein
MCALKLSVHIFQSALQHHVQRNKEIKILRLCSQLYLPFFPDKRLSASGMSTVRAFSPFEGHQKGSERQE